MKKNSRLSYGFIREATKIVQGWNGTGHLEILSLSRSQVIENFKQYFASPNRYFTETSRWVHLKT